MTRNAYQIFSKEMGKFKQELESSTIPKKGQKGFQPV
jgi:hypothetical protein